MRKLFHNKQGSVYPVLIFIIILAVVGFIILLFNQILTPFYQLGHSEDTSINNTFDQPRQALNGFLDIFWPKGLMLICFIILGYALFMDYQKERQGGMD